MRPKRNKSNGIGIDLEIMIKRKLDRINRNNILSRQSLLILDFKIENKPIPIRETTSLYKHFDY